ncbi:MAG: flagellar motor protein MotB [Desulfovibrionaceae bacterium]
MRHVNRYEEDPRAFDLYDEEGVAEATAWAVPWSDLMMVMFVLFVVLYVYASTHKDVMLVFTDRPAPLGAPELPSALDGAIAGLLARHGGDDPEVIYKSGPSGVSILQEGDDVRVTLRGDDFFAQGSTALAPGAAGYLLEVAQLLRMSHGDVRVVGYSDASEPGGVDGFAFTARRAGSVAAWFIENAGIDPGRFSVVGRGDNAPEVPTTASNHENVNRRVDIVIRVGA